MHLLPTNLAPVAAIAAKEATKFAMNGVRLTVNPDNSYRVVATDSKRLLMVEGLCEDAADFPDLPGVSSAPNGESVATIPTKTWADTFTAAAKFTKKSATHKPILAHVATVIGKDVATFGTTNLEKIATEQTRLIEGRYPPHEEMWPRKTQTPALVVHVPADLLANLLTTMAKFCDPAGTHPRVTLEFYDRPVSVEPGVWPTIEVKRPFILRCNNGKATATGLMEVFIPKVDQPMNEQCQVVTGLVMPLS